MVLQTLQPQHSFEPGTASVVVGRIYAEWCPPCRNLAPNWKKLEADMARDARVKFVSIESNTSIDDIKSINSVYFRGAQKLELASYPTIFTIDVKRKVLSYYSGNRDVSGLRAMVDAAIKTATRSPTGGARNSRKSRRNPRKSRRRGQRSRVSKHI